MLVIHHDDADGRCSAAIVLKKYVNQNPTFVGMDYAKDPPIEKVKPGEPVYIVDFSLKPDQIRLLETVTKNIVWIDHHASCKNNGLDYLPGLRDFTDKGPSGCELAWRYCFPDKAMPEAVSLIGDYDAWRLEHGERTKLFYEGLKVEDTNPRSQLWEVLLLSDEMADLVQQAQSPAVEKILEKGRVATAYRDVYCADIMKSYGFETEIDGIRAFATNLYRFGSPGFGRKFKEYPICLAFVYDGNKYTVSLYSETVDVSLVAKKFGGGGHKGAAGFVCDRLPFGKIRA